MKESFADRARGVNDMLPGLGLMWSREPHQLTLTDSWTTEARLAVAVPVLPLAGAYSSLAFPAAR